MTVRDLLLLVSTLVIAGLAGIIMYLYANATVATLIRAGAG